MALRYGTTVNMSFMSPERPAELARYMRVAEDIGVTRLGCGDSQFYGWDACITATLLAQASTRTQVGLAPTNPLTREPAVMAAFLAGLDLLCDGRAWLLMASGDSAAYNAGLKPATRACMEEYIECMRGLISSGEGTYQGRPQVVRWAKETKRSRVPIFLLAEGPRMLHLAGRIADGVVLGNGVLPEVVEDSKRRIEAGAREAGRRLEDIELWWAVRPSLRESHEEAMGYARTSVSSGGNHSMRFGLEGKMVPKQLEAKVAAYVKAYKPHTHMALDGPNVQAMKELGLTDYFLERFAVAGDPPAFRERVKQLQSFGVENIWFSGISDQREMDLFAEKVAPYL